MEILFYWKILKVDSRHEIWISSNNFSVPYKFYVLFFDFYCYLSLIKLTLNNKSFYLFPQNFRQERTTRVCCLVNHVIQEILCMLLFVIVAHIDRVLCDHDIIPGTWDSWHCTVTLSRCHDARAQFPAINWFPALRDPRDWQIAARDSKEN